MSTTAGESRASDVAAYLLSKHGPLAQMKLHKLLYYCQAYSLKWDRRPLFGDRIEAWMNGPVVPSLWHAHSYEYIIKEVSGDPSALGKASRATVDAVYEAFGKFSGVELSQFTHAEEPWLEARMGLGSNARSSRVITVDSLQRYFGNDASSD